MLLPGQGDFAEAAGAYEAGSDWESAVRLYLDHLQAPQKAAALVRKGCTREGAMRLAQHCMSTRDHQARHCAAALICCLHLHTGSINVKSEATSNPKSHECARAMLGAARLITASPPRPSCT